MAWYNFQDDYMWIIYYLYDKAYNDMFPAYIVKTTFPGDFSLKSYIEERAISIANYIIENNATVRQTAREFKVSKSTVHKDVTERLLQLNPSLAKCARKVLDVNKQERHIRGGMATREKYLHKVQK